MRVRGDNAPSNAFSLEEQPNKPGVALVRFYENAEPFVRRISPGAEYVRRPE